MKILLVFICIAFINAVSILDQSKYCFSYPRTVTLTQSLASAGSSPSTEYYTVNGDLMVMSTLSTPAKTFYGAINGSVNFGEVNVTNALNNIDILLSNLQDLPCEFYIDSVTPSTLTFYKGVNCITSNALNGVLRIAFINTTLQFNATAETSESKWFIIKFPPSRAAEFDNAMWDFVGDMDPTHDIVWVHWGSSIVMRQLNVLLPTQELYGVFIVPGFTYSVRVSDVMHKIYGGLFSIGAITSAGNNSVISDGNPLFIECEPITYISWGNNASLSEIIFVAVEVLRGTTVSNGNNSVNVYGSYAQEFPYLSSNIYTNWYVQNQLYFPLTDSTYNQVKSQRVDIYSVLGRMPCESYDSSTTISTVITIYPGSTCLGRATISFSASAVNTIIFDGRNETNATFFVRTRGFSFSGLETFQFTYINGANRTRMHWTDSRSFSLGSSITNANVTLEGNFYFNNISISNKVSLTIIGSLFVKYVLVNGASTLNIYPFSDGSLTGDIFGIEPVVPPPTLVPASCTYANGTCEYGLNVTCPSPAVYVENQICPETTTVDNTTTIDNTTIPETPQLSDVSIYIVYAVLFGTVGAGVLFVILRIIPGANNQGYQPVTVNEV